MVSWFIPVLGSFLTVLILTPLAIKLAFRLNFLDYPKGHKSHAQPIPLLGGAAVFLGLTVGLALALLFGGLEVSKALVGFYLSSLMVVVLGLIDDKIGLSPSWKLSGQLVAVLCFLVFYDSSLTSFAFPLGTVVILFWLVGLVNAMNFLDNMDGLCSGISLVASLAFAVLAFLGGQVLLGAISLSLAGGLAAFLKYNRSPAKIFLGDAGSMLAGFTLAALGLFFVSEIRTQYAMLVPLLILSYPIFDISFVTFTRLKQGRKVYKGGRDHSSHRLVEWGIASQKAVWGIMLVSALLAAMGVLAFYYFASPFKILIPLAIAFALTLFGIHLHRSFLEFKEKLILIFLDFLAINSAFLFTLNLKGPDGSLPQLAGLSMDGTTGGILLCIFWINLFAISGLYEFYWGMLLREEFKAILKTVLGGGLVLLLLSGKHILGQSETISMVGLYLLVLFAGLVFFRSLVIWAERKLGRTGILSRKAVILGTENMAEAVWRESQDKPEGLRVVGFIDENHKAVPRRLPAQVLGNVDNLTDVLRRNKVREVLVAVEPNWPGYLPEVLERAQDLEVNFRIRSELLPRVRGLKTSPLFGPGFCKIYPSQMRTWEWGIKRLMDLFLASVILILTLPIFLGLLVKAAFSKDGPLFSTVNILGRKGLALKLKYFNSTRQARWWHKLPLLLSVLKGDLSLIGPSWVLTLGGEEGEKLGQQYHEILRVRPGLLNPPGSKISTNGVEPDSLESNLAYIEGMSFTRDIGVILHKAAHPISKT